ncbi:hypothetical protein Q5427_11020 [Brochothrix thermosphacta]|uniref:hypothetical protein n=1 Tax=Brochothrix thermosphacta TaxID=2756 RepID=UPI00271248F9|nr:hypothetical protein [Brochothrix thermosphacta]MDO7864820.1 hypothetical protein [Brochothrix thermosphacta]
MNDYQVQLVEMAKGMYENFKEKAKKDIKSPKDLDIVIDVFDEVIATFTSIGEEKITAKDAIEKYKNAMTKSDPDLKFIFERIIYDFKEMDEGFTVLVKLEELVKSDCLK